MKSLATTTRQSKAWTLAEIERLRVLLQEDGVTLQEAAVKLGRRYYGVALKASTLEPSTRQKRNKVTRKAPRGIGLDRHKVNALFNEFFRAREEKPNLTISAFLRPKYILVQDFLAAARIRCSERFYKVMEELKIRSAVCPGCLEVFYDTSGRREFCSDRCASRRHSDLHYFGGDRLKAVGIVEGLCQLCLEPKAKGLASHHLIGKENDPENKLMSALCKGCHEIVTQLAVRKFLDDTQGWERLVSMVMMRRLIRPDSFRTKAHVKAEVNIRTLTLDELVNEEDVDPADLGSLVPHA